MLEIQSEISREKNEEFVGKTVKVLVEGRSKTDENMLTGRNERGRLIHFPGDDSLIGRFINVEITKAQTYDLIAEYTEE